LEQSAVIERMRNRSLLKVLAGSFLAGELSVEQVTGRGMQTLGRRWRWLRPLARRYVDAFAGKTRPTRRDVAQFLAQDQGFLRVYASTWQV
jgi:hypothetical protein